MIRRILAGLVVVVFAKCWLLTAPALAQEPQGGIDRTIEALDQGAQGSMNQETFIIGTGDDGQAGMLTSIGDGLTLFLVGEPPPDLNAGSSRRKPRIIGATQTTAHLMNNMVSQQPAEVGTYIADLGRHLGIPGAEEAYAQGTGFTALSPVIEIWKAFRNVAYMIFVLIMVVVGFMIMMRKKINPQTVVNIENSLPQIIFTLLLITFSYAIAALVIDLIYVVIYFVLGIFELNGLILSGGVSQIADKLFSNNLFRLMYSNTANLYEHPAQAIENAINGLLGGTWLADAISWLGGSLTRVIFAVVIAFSIFRLFFTLAIAYLKIILSVIFAPIILLGSALPGGETFSGWLKGILANASVFPVAALLILLAHMLVGVSPEDVAAGKNDWYLNQDIGFKAGAKDNSGWVPPLLSVNENSGEFSANNWLAVIAMVLIVTINTIVTQVKNMISESKFLDNLTPMFFGNLAAPYNIYSTMKGYQEQRRVQQYYKEQMETARTGRAGGLSGLGNFFGS